MATQDGFDPWHLLHLTWVAVSGLFIWNGKQFAKRMDDLESGKAEKDAVQERHVENQQRFNEVIDRLAEQEGTFRARMHELNNTVNKIALDVAVLSERSRVEQAEKARRSSRGSAP